MPSHIPLLVIGAGPAALTAAIYAGRAGHPAVVYTGTERPGGDLTTTTTVDNFPGFPGGIQGPELIERMQEQAIESGADIRFDDITHLDVAGKTATTRAGETLSFDAVIFATGSQHRTLGLPNEQALTGRGVSYCATCDAPFFAGAYVAVVGGGDTAMEEALALAKYAHTVYVVARGDRLRASKAMQDRVNATSNITLILDSTVVILDEQDGALRSVLIEHTTSTDEVLEVTGLFIAIGSDPRTELVQGQVALSAHGTICTIGRTSTVPGVAYSTAGFFAAGDVIDPIYRQAVIAAGSGAVAGLDAVAYLDELPST